MTLSKNERHNNFLWGRAKAAAQRPILRAAAVVAGGTAGAQIISAAFAPILARLYGPEAFGIFGTFAAAVAILSPAAALMYPVATVLPSDDRDAGGLVILSAIASVIFASLLSIAIVVGSFNGFLPSWAEKMGLSLYFIPVAVFFAAWQQITKQWLIRRKAFGGLATSEISVSAGINTVKGIVGLFAPSGPALIAVTALGQGTQAFQLASLSYRLEVRMGGLPAILGRGRLCELARCYRDFPLYRMTQTVMNALAHGLPVILLTAFFDPIAAGLYALSRTIMQMPLALISTSAASVLYPRMAEIQNRGGDLTSLIFKTTLGLLGVGAPAFLAVIFFGPKLFTVLLGAEWTVAGEFAQWLAIYYFVDFVSKPCIVAIPVLTIQRGFLIYEISRIFATFSAFAITVVADKPAVWVIANFSLVGAAWTLALMLWVGYTSKRANEVMVPRSHLESRHPDRP